MRANVLAWLLTLCLRHSSLALPLALKSRDVAIIMPATRPQRSFFAASLDTRRKKATKHKHKSKAKAKSTSSRISTRTVTSAQAAASKGYDENEAKGKCRSKQVSSSSTASAATAAKTTPASSTSNNAKATSTTSATATSTSTAAKPTLTLTSNDSKYGYKQLEADYRKITSWAYDEDAMSTAQVNETLAAILSAAARYFPEVDTMAMARIVLGDIRAESDFDPENVNGGRLDSGASVGLLQVSPGGGSQELALFKSHAQVDKHSASGDEVSLAVKASGVQGSLIDWKTGKTMNVTALTEEDVLRPWVNIHMALWIQSNLARSSSSDPYDWQAIAKGKKTVADTGSRKVTPTVKTGLGSWVAGPGADSDGYRTSGDDISKDYFTNIMQGVRVLYGDKKMDTSWLGQWSLKPGLIDYH